jgi:hypothetical protein
MGCDIHLFTEMKRDQGKWKNIDYWQHNYFYDAEDPDSEREMDLIPIYRGRDYDLFGILAGVRNEENPKIDDPRGLPPDVCEITKKESDRWTSDGHSHSFFTLKELKDHLEKNPTMKRSGMVTKEAAAKLDSGEETPRSWAGWVSKDLGYVHREWEEKSSLYYLVQKLDERCRQEFWIRSSEDTNGRYEDEKNFRIVFWFDN